MSSVRHIDSATHGSMKSYVTGFLLSLVFTFIPYFMVVNEMLKGTVLLTTILVVAMIQMTIQIVFFLHLGRGPKPNWNLYFFASTISITAVVVGGSVFIIRNLHYNMSPEEKVKKLLNDENIYQIGGESTGVCRELYTNHIVTIENGKVTPEVTGAQACDTLTFINKDEPREITFGDHPGHGTYAGEGEFEVRNGKNKTITLSETGDYKFHDHEAPDTAGSFSVAPR